MERCECCEQPFKTCECYKHIASHWCEGCNKCPHHCICRDIKEDRPAPGQEPEPTTVAGMGKDAPTITNTAGGRQSAIPFQPDLLPFKAIIDLAGLLTQSAAKYGRDNWRLIPRTDHANHAIAHLFAYFAGDTQDDHLLHAACRLLFALETT